MGLGWSGTQVRLCACVEGCACVHVCVCVHECGCVLFDWEQGRLFWILGNTVSASKVAWLGGANPFFMARSYYPDTLMQVLMTRVCSPTASTTFQWKVSNGLLSRKLQRRLDKVPTSQDFPFWTVPSLLV